MAWPTSTTPLLLLVVVLAAVAQTQAIRPRQVADAADPPSSSVETLSVNLASAGADGHSPAAADHVATKMERVEDDDDESSSSLQAPAASPPDVPAPTSPPKDDGGGIAGLFAGLWRRFWRLDEPYHRAVPGIKEPQYGIVGDRDGLN